MPTRYVYGNEEEVKVTVDGEHGLSSGAQVSRLVTRE